MKLKKRFCRKTVLRKYPRFFFSVSFSLLLLEIEMYGKGLLNIPITTFSLTLKTIFGVNDPSKRFTRPKDTQKQTHTQYQCVYRFAIKIFDSVKRGYNKKKKKNQTYYHIIVTCYSNALLVTFFDFCKKPIIVGISVTHQRIHRNFITHCGSVLNFMLNLT